MLNVQRGRGAATPRAHLCKPKLPDSVTWPGQYWPTLGKTQSTFCSYWQYGSSMNSMAPNVCFCLGTRPRAEPRCPSRPHELASHGLPWRLLRRLREPKKGPRTAHDVKHKAWGVDSLTVGTQDPEKLKDRFGSQIGRRGPEFAQKWFTDPFGRPRPGRDGKGSWPQPQTPGLYGLFTARPLESRTS